MTGKNLAQIINPVIPEGIGSGEIDRGTTIFGTAIGAIIGVFVVIAFIISMFYMIVGGLSWITAAGDKGKLEEARNKIRDALIGLIVVVSVWGIMNIVAPFVGISFPELPFPTIESLME